MKKDNVIGLVQPGEFKDHLTEVLRQGAQALVLQAVEAEFAVFLESHSPKRLEHGRQIVVRHGHLPERKVVTWIGSQTDRNQTEPQEPALPPLLTKFDQLYEAEAVL